MAEKTVYIIDLDDKVTGKLKGVEKEAKKTDDSFKSIGGSLKGFGAAAAAAFSIGAIANFASEVVQTTAKFQSLSNSIKFASDNAAQGEISMGWLADISKTYGLPIEQLTQGFKTFQGAMMNTNFTSGETRKMFGQVSTGVTAMGLSADDAQGVFLALGQIMGKGKVQAEELRGQIGERIPGAFAIAADAMNMTTAELDKFMADGKLMAEDFLPKFAAEMEKTFGEGAIMNADSLSSSLTRASNAWTEMTLAMGNSDTNGLIGGTLELWTSMLDSIGNKFRNVDQLSKKAVSGDIKSKVDSEEAAFRDQARFMKASGMSKTDIRDNLRNSMGLAGSVDSKDIEVLKSQIAAFEKGKGITGGFGSDHRKSQLYTENDVYKSLVDDLEVKTATSAARGSGLEKILEGLFAPPAVVAAKKAKKGRTGSDGLTLNESRNGATHITFNIDTFQKNEFAKDGVGVNNSAIKGFLDQMALGLQTVLNDSQIVARQ